MKDLLGGTIKEMLESEMEEHLGCEKSARSDSDDNRNGYKSKRITTSYGGMEIEVPQDRKSTFKAKVVKKRQKDISEIDQKIISIYVKGMTTRLRASVQIFSINTTSVTKSEIQRFRDRRP